LPQDFSRNRFPSLLHTFSWNNYLLLLESKKITYSYLHAIINNGVEFVLTVTFWRTPLNQNFKRPLEVWADMVGNITFQKCNILCFFLYQATMCWWSGITVYYFGKWFTIIMILFHAVLESTLSVCFIHLHRIWFFCSFR